MPNHFHGILNITNDQKIKVPSGQKPKLSLNGTSPNSIGRIIQTFKSISTNEYISGVKSSSWKRFSKKLWQRNYWEHIIRDHEDYIEISHYITNNPAKWDNDKLNLKNK